VSGNGLLLVSQLIAIDEKDGEKMKINWTSFLLRILAEAGIFLALTILFLFMFSRPLIKWIVGRATKRLMSDPYGENVWEMVTASTRVSPIAIIENSLRAASGEVIKRPFGSPRKFVHFDGLIFSPAQLHRLPSFANAPVDMKITIGPCAKKPLNIDIPLLAAGMGYAIALNAKVKRAIARATAATGTATNSGQGAFLPDERELAKYFILQYTAGNWSKSPEILRQADAIEIYLGQGASAASAHRISPEDLPGEIRDAFQLTPDETLVIPSRFEEINKPEDLRKIVDSLREITGGVPIGVKICGGGEIEMDLDAAILAGVDFISIDGGQAGSRGSTPILEDDFGLPTIYLLSRAVRFLNKKGMKDQISLLVGGGFNTPGDCLKAIALGADAVYMGTAFVWAMTHDQITKTLPWEPPTHLVFYPSKIKEQFSEDKAAKYLENFINSYVEEMKEAIRSLGKSSIKDVNSEDLVALDELTSKITNVPLGYGGN
jgi:glutamate synthase domain-containing protein 2